MQEITKPSRKYHSFHIETFGCQMNKGDSELIYLSLIKSGFIKAESPAVADILVFNSCSVRQHAEDRVISRIKSARSSNKSSIIILAGCVAQRKGQNLLDEKLVNLVIGPYESPKAGEIIKAFLSGKNKALYDSQTEEDFQSRVNFDLAEIKDESPWHKWVTITHGCENFCSYCIVPYVRGPLISLPSERIIEYVKKLAANDIREITLLGQNVNQYGENGDISFGKLLNKVAQINGIERINFLTSHPKDFDENIIHVIRDNENISRAIHLPLQSGSNAILKSMNRKYTIEQYYKLIEKIDSILDSYSVSTDMIVGFPGESAEDYKATLDAVKKIRFDDAFMYAYSPREGTAAFSIEETISIEEKMNRLGTLIDLQRKISREKLESKINSLEVMIVERISKRSADEVMGKTHLNHPVIVRGIRDDIGKKITIKITGLRGNTLYGKRIA